MIRLAILCLLPCVAVAAPLTFQQTGRLLDTAGEPIQGEHSLRVRLYDAEGNTDWDRTYVNQPFDQGYYSVVLETDASNVTLDEALASATPPIEVGIQVIGQASEITPRMLLHAVPHAAVANAVPAQAALFGAACPGDGALRYDLDLNSLVVCSAGTWSAVSAAAEGLSAGVEFTTCGQTGRFGPSAGNCTTAYAATPAILDNLSVTNGIQTWTVPQTGTYRIEAWGGEGGGRRNGCSGGLGGYAAGSIDLVSGQQLRILVGHQGGSVDDSQTRTSGGSGALNGAGGGGSFVATASNTPLIVAGGGGGRNPEMTQCIDATLQGGQTSYSGPGGGEVQDSSSGGGGGGFAANGTTSTHPDNGCAGGASFLNGGVGGYANHGAGYTYYTSREQGSGGFGGGGGPRYWSSGAGGGGYHGGKGWNSISSGSSQSGGTNYASGANASSQAGMNSGHGRVRITLE